VGLVAVYLLGRYAVSIERVQCGGVAEMLYVAGEGWSGELMEGFSCAFAK
jgi:hypothetical protein